MKNYFYLFKQAKHKVLRSQKATVIIVVAAVFLLFSSNASAQNCNCSANPGPELVQNPEIGNNTTFPNCYMGYLTDFTTFACGSSPGAAFSNGECIEGPGASTYLGTWAGVARSAPRCLIYDGPVNGDLAVWRQTINVSPGRVYRFSAFFQSTCPGCRVNPTTVYLRVNAQNLQGANARATANASSPNNWSNVCGLWRSDAATTAVVEIMVVSNPDSSGNDGAIDDVSFMEMAVQADASFSFNTPRCDIPVQFTSAGTGSHSWDFGDGTTSTLQSPSHLYNGGGVFIVTHTVTNSCDTAVSVDTVKLLNCCKCEGCGTNLVKNGDFRDTCHAAYESDLLPHPCPNGSTSPDHYTEVTDASISYPATWCGLDHTPGGGTKFLVLDAPHLSPASKKGWKQRVKVQPGHMYCYSAWVRNICYQGPSLPSVFLQAGNDVVAGADDIPYNSCCDGWTKICGTWTAPAGIDSVELSISIKSGAWVCTDVGIDDISFSDISVAPDANFTISSERCVGDSITFTRGDSTGQSSWNFGDGGTSTLSNPKHIYAAAGKYTVTHIITTPCGTDTVKKIILIKNCCCTRCGPELIPNGTFSTAACNTGYTSTLTLHGNCPSTVHIFPGQFTEDDSAQTVEANWYGFDHTGVSGSRFLILDYRFPNPVVDTGWAANVPVIPGKKYCLTLYVKNLYVLSTLANSPAFEIRINGLPVYTEPPLAFDSGWKKICVQWTAPAGVNIANLRLLLMPAGGGLGFDLGVDDISFGEDCSQSSPAMPQQEETNETGDNGSLPPTNSLTMDESVSVYPVPVKKGETVYISYESKSDEHITLSVFDESGKQVMASHEHLVKGANTLAIKTVGLSAGVYYIRFYPPTSENGVQKMIVIE